MGLDRVRGHETDGLGDDLEVEEDAGCGSEFLQHYQHLAYHLQLIGSLFRIESAYLIQNQIAVFRRLFQSDDDPAFRVLLEGLVAQCESYGRQDLERWCGARVFVPEDLVQLTYVVRFLTELIRQQSPKSKQRQEMCALFPLARLRALLRTFHGWHFLEFELLDLFKESFLKNEKLSEEDRREVFQFFSEDLAQYLRDYLLRRRRQSQERSAGTQRYWCERQNHLQQLFVPYASSARLLLLVPTYSMLLSLAVLGTLLLTLVVP